MDHAVASSSTHENNQIECSICNSKTDEHLIQVGLKGKKTLKTVSIDRGDKKFATLDLSEDVHVHASCRKLYTHAKNVEAAKRKLEAQKTSNISPTKRKLRKSSDSSSNDTFDWERYCFLCGEEAIEEKEKKKPVERRKKIISIISSDYASSILMILTKLNDDAHREVYKRISGIQDFMSLHARYHKDCDIKLRNEYVEMMKSPKTVYSDKIDQAMEEIYHFMLTNDECQFTITQLIDAIKHSDIKPSEETVKQRLMKKFSDQIVISSRVGGVTYVCFSNNLYDILTDAWYSNRPTTKEEEENKLIDSASELIRRKIRQTIVRTNEYPTSDKMFDDINQNIPPHLLRFLNNVIYKDKEQNENNKKWYSKKISSIAHAIMSAARPKSFVSALQLAVGATFYRKFGSKKIIEICYNLGFCCSYSEIKLYEICAAGQAERVLLNPFLQIVSDNSDFNVCTIDGRGTFHNLGSIEIITPANSLQDRKPIVRCHRSEIPKQSELVEKNRIDLLLYTKPAGSGLKLIKVESFKEDPSFKTNLIDQLNILWMYFKYVRENEFLGWNGFMCMMTSCRENYEVSVVNFLPFINASPSDYNTLFTALQNAAAIVSKEGMKTLIVTFDQPLYIKARDIVEATFFDQIVVIVRLGGFHLLMSFMGCIGQIMAGSGIKEILSLIYAEGSVDKMLNGHSYARAVRAHIILQQVLSIIIMDELKKENADFQKLLESEENLTFDMNIDEINSNECFIKINEIFEVKLNNLEERGNTCKLWVQYFRMVSLLKTFLAAERMGDWKLHLECIRNMLPFFHAAGHFNYSKSARLYLQDMKQLESKIDPVEYKRFTEDGYFTSRRSNTYWAGIFSDQTIEQTLMRAMSVEGGPFKRGSSESVVIKWIKGILYTKDIIEGLEHFCDLQFNKSHQHVDSRDARINRDKQDAIVLQQFLTKHNPFEDIDNLRNIVTGMVATDEINCHNALTIGIVAMKAIDGKNFNEIKQSRKDKVIPLLGVNSKLKIGEKTITVDPLLLFQRISVMKKSDEELQFYLKFELAPYPLSLFDDSGMRKTAKASLYSLFETLDITLDKNNSLYVIDGGMLLYRVKWQANCKYEDIFQQYITYLRRNFGNHIIVVFDSYDEQSTKIVERNRRNKQCSTKEYIFTKDMMVPVPQDKFLSDYKNKSRFIEYLIEEFQKQSIKCYQGKGEADELLVKITIEDESSLQKVIVAEDVDILVILTARAEAEKEIYFLKLGKQNVPSLIYSSNSFAVNYPNSAKLIAFSHAFTGCDTTSAFFNKGKKKFFDLIEKRSDLQQKAEIFYNSNSDIEAILEAGRYCSIILYGAAKDVQVQKMNNVEDLQVFLEQMRYEYFIKATTKNNAVKLSSLVPTVDAINEHVKRCYLQTQVWLGNENIKPTDWGWEKSEGTLRPISMQNTPAPQELLKMIFCNCKKGCGVSCSCRKVGLFCNSTCGECSGQNCQNSGPITDQDEEEEIESDDDF